MSFESLKHILPQSFQKKSGGVARQVEAVLVVQKFQTVVEGMWGAVMTDRVRAVSLKDGILTIACLSPAAAAELRLREAELQEKINGHFGKTAVRGFFTQL